MFAIKTLKNVIEQWRSKGFMLLTGILALALLAGGTFEFIPAWILRNPSDVIHLWHIAELGALSAIFLGGIMLALLRQPEEKPLVAQFFVVGGVILALSIAPFEIKGAALLLIVALFVLAYPNRRGLLSFAREGSISIALLALGLLSSTKRPGWKELGVITGATYCYLGVIAMIVPGDAGSWGYTGGLFSIIGGVLYMLFTLVEVQSARVAAESESVTQRGTKPVTRKAFTPEMLSARTGELAETLPVR